MPKYQRQTISYAEEAAAVLTDYHIPFSKWETSTGTVLSLPNLSKDDPDISLHIRISKSGDSQFIAYPVRSIPKEKIPDILTLLNTLNHQYRYVTFSIDEDGDLCASYDVIFHAVGDELLYTLMNALRVFLDVTDPVMKAVKEALHDGEDEDGIQFVLANLFGED